MRRAQIAISVAHITDIAVLEAASHYRRSAQGVSVGEVLLWAAELVAERE